MALSRQCLPWSSSSPRPPLPWPPPPHWLPPPHWPPLSRGLPQSHWPHFHLWWRQHSSLQASIPMALSRQCWLWPPPPPPPPPWPPRPPPPPWLPPPPPLQPWLPPPHWPPPSHWLPQCHWPHFHSRWRQHSSLQASIPMALSRQCWPWPPPPPPPPPPHWL